MLFYYIVNEKENENKMNVFDDLSSNNFCDYFLTKFKKEKKIQFFSLNFKYLI